MLLLAYVAAAYAAGYDAACLSAVCICCCCLCRLCCCCCWKGLQLWNCPFAAIQHVLFEVVGGMLIQTRPQQPKIVDERRERVKKAADDARSKETGQRVPLALDTRGFLTLWIDGSSDNDFRFHAYSNIFCLKSSSREILISQLAHCTEYNLLKKQKFT